MLKKVLFLTALAFVTLASQAQSDGKFGVWYGVNSSKVKTDYDSPKAEFKALNIGIDYTGAISEAFDWTAGVAYVTKGCKKWDPGFIQIDANATWNFMKKDNFKIGVFTGPYLDITVNKDKIKDSDYDYDIDEYSDDDYDDEYYDDEFKTKTFSWGWGAGLKASYKAFSLKAGYELGLSNIMKHGKSKMNGIYVRVGYSF